MEITVLVVTIAFDLGYKGWLYEVDFLVGLGGDRGGDKLAGAAVVSSI
jgi:hypothetical protein